MGVRSHRRCSTPSEAAVGRCGTVRTTCTWSGSPSPAPTRAARAAPSPSRSRTRPSKSTAPPRFWRPARRSGSRCRSAAGWASAKPACCRWNQGHVRDFRSGDEHGAGDRINTCVSTASGDCTLEVLEEEHHGHHRHQGVRAPHAEDVEELARELDAIRADIEESRGERDARYIRRAIQLQRGLAVGGRAVLFASRNKVAWVARHGDARPPPRSSRTWNSATTSFTGSGTG